MPLNDLSSSYGEEVLLVRTGFDGEIDRTYIPAAIAVLALMDGDMGVVWASARIVTDEVNLGLWDRSC